MKGRYYHPFVPVLWMGRAACLGFSIAVTLLLLARIPAKPMNPALISRISWVEYILLLVFLLCLGLTIWFRKTSIWVVSGEVERIMRSCGPLACIVSTVLRPDLWRSNLDAALILIAIHGLDWYFGYIHMPKPPDSDYDTWPYK